MKKGKIIAFLILMTLTMFVNAQDILEFRNNGRTGVYNETGLLKVWPENGPKMNWSVENLPKGYASLTISNNTILLVVRITMRMYLLLWT